MGGTTYTFPSAILEWFRVNGRKLPWRETTDAYAIWLSEVILQQTRIGQGWEYWERFIRTYPKVEDLAKAEEDDVLKLWQGLGYYSRARNLHAAARQVVAMGDFPHTLEGVKALKGVGDYTAAAICSFAFGLPVAVVDGNVYRVLSRYFGIDTPINTTAGKNLFANLAQSLLPAEASAYNQGIMDFGAIQCTPLSPKCMLCPIADTCEALRTNKVEKLPMKLKKKEPQIRYLCYIYIRCKGEVAFRRRGKGDIWQGLWEPFNASAHETEGTTSAEEVARMLCLSGHSALLPVAHNVKHVLTHRILYADFYVLETPSRPPLPPEYIWLKETDIGHLGIPRLIEIMLEKIHDA